MNPIAGFPRSCFLYLIFLLVIEVMNLGSLVVLLVAIPIGVHAAIGPKTDLAIQNALIAPDGFLRE